MVEKKFKNGETIEILVTAQGGLLKVQENVTGLATAFNYADVRDNLSEIVPYYKLVSTSNGSSKFVCDNSVVVLSDAGELYMFIKGGVD